MHLQSSPKLSRSRIRSIAKKACRVTVFGPPGGGKGTQCAKLTRDYDFLVLSTGDELRKIAKQPTDLGNTIRKLITNGDLVDNSLLLKMMEAVLIKPKLQSFIVDGFPRTIEQATLFDDVLEKNRVPLQIALMLDVPHEVIVERISCRRVHLPSGRVYHTTYNPPKVSGLDDVTGEPLVQRSDDQEETVRGRLEKYQQKTLPLLEYYRKKGILVTIPSPTSDEGYVHIKAFFDQYFSSE